MDTEKLISTVQQHPALYNTSHPDYIRIRAKDEIWDKIGAKFGLEGTFIKEKWIKLRDCHREALRRQKNKSQQRRGGPRPWIYQQEMEFLLPFMKTTSLPSLSEPSNTANEFDEFGSKDNDDIQLSKTEESTTENFRKRMNIDSEETAAQEKEVKRRKLLIKPHSIQQFLGQCEERAHKRDELRRDLISSNLAENDALYLFFIAMYGAAKQLPTTYQRRIRNEIFDVISRTEEDYDLKKSRHLEATAPARSISDCSPLEDRAEFFKRADISGNISEISTNDIFTEQEENLYDESIEIKEELL